MHKAVHWRDKTPATRTRAIPFSLSLRLRRICSTDPSFFNKRCCELINFLALRGYSRRLLIYIYWEARLLFDFSFFEVPLYCFESNKKQ